VPRAGGKWGLHDIGKASARHGTYSSFSGTPTTMPGKSSPPQGGYTWIFEQGDLEGRGHFERASGTSAPMPKNQAE